MQNRLKCAIIELNESDSLISCSRKERAIEATKLTGELLRESLICGSGLNETLLRAAIREALDLIHAGTKGEEAIEQAALKANFMAPRDFKVAIGKVLRTYPRRKREKIEPKLTDEQIADLVEIGLTDGLHFGDAIRPILKKQLIPGPKFREMYGRIGTILSKRRQQARVA